MECAIREWKIEDAARLAEMLNNKKILNNLRDGLPYPYTKSDAEEYITSMLEADKMKTFSFAITVDDKVVGSIGVFRCDNIHFGTAEPFAYNIASCRVLEKAGFQFEGLLRNNAIKNGKVLDMRMYSLIKEFISK